MDIEEFLKLVCDELKEYTSKADKLCKLLRLDFSGGKLPDYSDENIQQLYLLRYAFAYIFEYTEMYKTLLETIPQSKSISVTSLGCGAMLDYAALRMALKKTDNVGTVVDYMGMDTVFWKYSMPIHGGDRVCTRQDNAAVYMNETENLSSDIYIFPHSVSDFTQDDFDSMCNAFATKHILKERIHILFSLRADKKSNEMDDKRCRRIIEAVESNSHKLKTDYNVNADDRKYNKAIISIDGEFCYPDDVLYFVKHLYNRCNEHKNCTEDYCHDMINRSPVLYAKHMRTYIKTFERREPL